MPVVTTDVQEHQKKNKRCVSTVTTNHLKIAVGSDPKIVVYIKYALDSGVCLT